MCVFECILVEVKRQLFCFHLAVVSGHWAYEANTLPPEPSCWPNLYSWVLRLGVIAFREECLTVYLYVSSFSLFEIKTENIILVYTYLFLFTYLFFFLYPLSYATFWKKEISIFSFRLTFHVLLPLVRMDSLHRPEWTICFFVSAVLSELLHIISYGVPTIFWYGSLC